MFEEFIQRVNQVVFLSATPGAYELELSTQVVEQIVRPTGLIDPEIIVRPTKGQIDDLVAEIRERAEADQRDPRHDAHEEDVGRPHRLPARARHPGPLSALGDRHARAHRDPAVAAARRVRRARRHQPAAGGSRPARGLARRDPRRRQGRLPALGHVADPDDRPCGAQRRRPGRDVRRPDDRLDDATRSPRRCGGARSSSNTTRSTASTRRPCARRSSTSST